MQYKFGWNNVKILDEESFYRKRLISEMLNIKKQINNFKLQTDIEGLHKNTNIYKYSTV